VDEAANGVEALAAIERAKPDLVLSDWNMPEMNGYEFLTALRSRGNRVPFGFITTESTPEMKAKASDAGALFLIAKPFTVEAFQAALNPILG
jgi:two-component system chemotaxis response regulator CheY